MEHKLTKIAQLLGMLEVKGYDNCAIVVACINEINSIKEEVKSLGNSNFESRSE